MNALLVQFFFFRFKPVERSREVSFRPVVEGGGWWGTSHIRRSFVSGRFTPFFFFFLVLFCCGSFRFVTFRFMPLRFVPFVSFRFVSFCVVSCRAGSFWLRFVLVAFRPQ